MASSAEEFRLAEPIEPPPDEAHRCSEPFRHEDIQGICANPLRDEPSPTVTAAVKRFGVVGLVTCAVATGLSRWWHSILH